MNNAPCHDANASNASSNFHEVGYEARAQPSLEQLGLSVAGEHLDTACQRAAAENWSYSHFLGYLLEGELQERHRKTVALNLQFARFPYLKRLEEFDFAAQPSLDRRLIEELATGRFLHEGRNIVFLGLVGSGVALAEHCFAWPTPDRCFLTDQRALLGSFEISSGLVTTSSGRSATSTPCTSRYQW